MADSVSLLNAAVESTNTANQPKRAIREVVRETIDHVLARNRGAIADLQAGGYGTVTLEVNFRAGVLVGTILTTRLTERP